MGLFTNPLGYAGYPPGATAPAQIVNSTVRSATATEVEAGVLDNVYVSPATLGSIDTGLFASPPPLGNEAPNTVAATTLTSSGNTTLASGTAVTTITLGAGVPAGARTTTFLSAGSGVNDTFNLFSGVNTAGTQQVNIFSGNSSGGTQVFNLFTGTLAGTTNIGTGAAVHVLNLLSSTGELGVFGKTAAVQQTQAAITNSVTAGGTTGTIANFTDLTVYANDSTAIRNDIYQLALALGSVITGLRAYGLLK